MREAWTDERLDDLSQRVSDGFADIRMELRGEIRSVREEIGSVRTEVGSVREEIAALQRSLLYCFVSLGTLMLTGFIGIAVTL